MRNGRTYIIDNSVHVRFILDCVTKGMSIPAIRQALLERGFKVSAPTLRDFVKRAKRDGLNLSKFRAETENTALEINDKLKNIKGLTDIFNRRNFLIDTLLTRRDKLIEYANEGPRTGWVINELNKLQKFLENNKKVLPIEDYLMMDTNLKNIQKYVAQNFLDSKCYPSLEDAIRKNTMDIHEICKYIEQWTSKYEVESLLEKLCEGLTKAAVNTFGPLLKSQSENYRKQYIEKFLNEVDVLMNDLRSYQLELQEKTHVQ